MELCWGQYLDLEYQAGQPSFLKDYLTMVALKTGTLVGACCEVAGNPAGMIDPSLPVFGGCLGFSSSTSTITWAPR